MIQNYDKFSRNVEFGKNLHTLKNSYSLNNDQHMTCDLLGQLCVF